MTEPGETGTANPASARKAPARIASTAQQRTATIDVEALRPLGGCDATTRPARSKTYPPLATEGRSDRNKPNPGGSTRYAVKKTHDKKNPEETRCSTNQPETPMRSLTRLDPLPDDRGENRTRRAKPDPPQEKSATRATRIASAGQRKTSEPMRKPPMWAAINRDGPLGKQAERSPPKLTGRTKSTTRPDTWSTASSTPPRTIEKPCGQTVKRTRLVANGFVEAPDTNMLYRVMQKQSKHAPHLIPTSEQNVRLPINSWKAPSLEPRPRHDPDDRIIVDPGTKEPEALELSLVSEVNERQHNIWDTECTGQLDPLPAVSLPNGHTEPDLKAHAAVMSSSLPKTVNMRVDVETIVAIHLPSLADLEGGPNEVARLNLDSSVVAQVQLIPAGAPEAKGTGPKLAKLFVDSGVSVNITAIPGSLPRKLAPKTIDIHFRENTQVLLSFLDGPGTKSGEDRRVMGSPSEVPVPASGLQNHSPEERFYHSRPRLRTNNDVNGNERQNETPLNPRCGGSRSDVGIREGGERDRGSASSLEPGNESQTSTQSNILALMESDWPPRPTILRTGLLPSCTATVTPRANQTLDGHGRQTIKPSHPGPPRISFAGLRADRDEVYANFKHWQEGHQNENQALEGAVGTCSTDKPLWTATKIVRMSWKGRNVPTQTALVRVAEMYDRERELALR